MLAKVSRVEVISASGTTRMFSFSRSWPAAVGLVGVEGVVLGEGGGGG